MTDCTNLNIRDRLPELATGHVPADEATVMRAHLAGCATCAAEFAAIQTSRLVLMASAPRVDVAAITRAVTGAKPALTVSRGGAAETNPVVASPKARTPLWRSRQFLAAAASILVVVSLTIPSLTRGPGESPAGTPDTTRVVTSDTPSAAVAVASVAVGGGLEDLSSDELSSLLAELDGLEATVTAEPAAIATPIVDTPEVF